MRKLPFQEEKSNQKCVALTSKTWNNKETIPLMSYSPGSGCLKKCGIVGEERPASRLSVRFDAVTDECLFWIFRI